MSNPDETFDPIGSETPSFRVPPEMPVLPLRDTVLFPQAFMPLAVARESSVRLVDDAISGSKLIGVFTQRDPTPLSCDTGSPRDDRRSSAVNPRACGATGSSSCLLWRRRTSSVIQRETRRSCTGTPSPAGPESSVW